MLLSELRAMLDEMQDSHEGDPLVLFAYQPSYPLQDHIAGVCAFDPEEEGKRTILYLVSDGQHPEQPYAPRHVFEEVIREL